MTDSVSEVLFMKGLIKLKISFLTAFVILPLLGGFFDDNKESECLTLFPELTVSSAVEFEENESECEQVQIVDQSEKTEIRFKLFDWLKSVF